MDNINDFLTNTIGITSFTSLKLTKNNVYTSFKIGVLDNDIAKLLQPTLWSLSETVREFVNRPHSSKKSRLSSNASVDSKFFFRIENNINPFNETLKAQDLKCCFINIQSIKNKVNEIDCLLQSCNIDVLCVNEHWLSDLECKNLIINNLQPVSYYARTNFKHGGTLILSKTIFKIKLLDDINVLSVDKHCELSAIYLIDYDCAIIVIYRSPSGNLNLFYEILTKSLNIVNKITNNIILGGDFNIHFNFNNPPSMK